LDDAERDELNRLSTACGESLMHLENGLKGVTDNLSLLQTLGPNSYSYRNSYNRREITKIDCVMGCYDKSKLIIEEFLTSDI